MKNFKDKVLASYRLKAKSQEAAKKWLRLKDPFYHPLDKEGTLAPRNGGYEFHEEKDVFYKEDPEDED